MFMRALLPNKRQLRLCSALLLLGAWTGSLAVELEQLHLPKSYLRYLPQLLDGGKLMAASERCHAFLSGELSLDNSRPDYPVFMYTCRDQNQYSYSLLVDGLTHEVLDPSRPSGRVSFAQLQAELEQQREQARARQVAQEAALITLQQQHEAELTRLERERQLREEIVRRERLWQECQQKLQKQTRNMLDLTWLTTTQPPAQPLTEDAVPYYRFSVDFNAVDPHKTALAYRAYCVFTDTGNTLHAHSIHPRLLEERKAREQAEPPSDE